MGLKLDYNKLIEDYLKYFYEELDWALKAWEAEVYQKTRFELESFKPQVESDIEQYKNKVIVFLYANTTALMDSFGTGSLMNITDNPNFEEYFKNKGNEKGQWNPERHGKTIVGRKSKYTDVFGRPKRGNSRFAGKPIEGKRFKSSVINPVPPSNAIPDANKALWNTYIPAAIKNARNKIKFSKYVIEVN